MAVATMNARTGLEQAFVAALNEFRQRLGYSIEEFGDDYVLSVSRLKNVLSGRTRPTRAFVEDVVDAMHDFLAWTAAHPYPEEPEAHEDFRAMAQCVIDAAGALR
ncbi:MAG TPA: helix-turn-helix transcriptional regulator [bacterium]|nr:helix-turn-helix transcriptional regulator [bacterium]